MKHITISTAFVFLSAFSFCQQTTPSKTNTKQDYLQKSKQQKKTALILVGGGVILEIAGVIAYQKGPAGLVMMGAGLVSQIISIPLFISAGINKHKSKKASVSFKLEKSQDFRTTIKSFRSNPEISLKLNL